MRNLFSLNQDGVVEILPQTWLLEPFNKVKDKYKDVGTATQEMGLVYFASDYRSDFLSVLDLSERIDQIVKHLYAGSDIVINDITHRAIHYYSKRQDTVKIRLIKAVTSAIERAITTISVASIDDLKEVRELSEISAKLPPMLENLDALEKFVARETKKEEGVVGAGDKGMYEDG